MRISLLTTLAALAAVLTTPVVRAHDLWFEPTTHEPAIGQAVGIQVRIGEHFKGDPITLAGAKLGDLFMADGGARRPVAVLRGAKPALLVRPQRAGTQVVAYRSEPIDITIPGETFQRYLAEEGLEAIAAKRVERGQAAAEAREAYMRCAKTLLQAGGAADDLLRDEALGLPLELVARDPIGRGTREARFQLLFGGRPLAGALVVALPEARPQDVQRQRTDARGEVVVRLEPGTRWLVKAVHMQAAPASDAPTAPQWLSWWASVTLALPGERAPGGPARPLSGAG